MGIVALVGAGLVAIYALIAVIQIIPYISVLFQVPSVLIAYVLLIAGAVVGVIGAVKAFKKTLASQIIRGVAAVILIVFGAMAAFEALMVIGLIVLAGSIALDYLVK